MIYKMLQGVLESNKLAMLAIFYKLLLASRLSYLINVNQKRYGFTDNHMLSSDHFKASVSSVINKCL